MKNFTITLKVMV